jgi:DNA-binding NarL/FixJ family response regulator
MLVCTSRYIFPCIALCPERLRVENGKHVMAARILLADDNPTIRRSLRTLLSRQADWTICGEAEDGKMAVEMAERLSPDLVILDLSMPVMNGLDATRQIKRNSPEIKILMFTMHEFPHLHEQARKAGVKELVPKTAHPSRLLNVLHAMLDA